MNEPRVPMSSNMVYVLGVLMTPEECSYFESKLEGILRSVTVIAEQCASLIEGRDRIASTSERSSTDSKDSTGSTGSKRSSMGLEAKATSAAPPKHHKKS